jgi:hypothetical protein
MTNEEPTSTDEIWRTRGREDAPVAQRAIIRLALADDHSVPGYACAYAILEAYGRDLKLVMPGVASVHASEHRLRLLSQLILDANNDEWIRVLSPSFDFMSEYRVGFIRELDSLMANWAPKPWKPGPNPNLVTEEGRWHLALAMGDLVLPKPREGWRRFLAPAPRSR